MNPISVIRVKFTDEEECNHQIFSNPLESLEICHLEGLFLNGGKALLRKYNNNFIDTIELFEFNSLLSVNKNNIEECLLDQKSILLFDSKKTSKENWEEAEKALEIYAQKRGYNNYKEMNYRSPVNWKEILKKYNIYCE